MRPAHEQADRTSPARSLGHWQDERAVPFLSVLE